MNQILTVLQIVISIILIGLILVQARGTGFGRGGGMGSASFTRRGLEKLIFKLSFVTAFLFIMVSTLRLVY